MAIRPFVLLVEDNDSDAEYLRRAMASAFDVKRVESYRELIQVERGLAPDIVLLDLGLPDTAEIDKVVMVRNVVRLFRKSAVVVMTGRDDRELAVKCRGVGAQEYLVKDHIPGSMEIESKLQGALAHRQMEIRQLHAAESITDFVDPSSIHERIDIAVRRAFEESSGPKKKAAETRGERLKEWLIGHAWQIGAVVVATVLYLVDFRDRIRDYTAETEDFKEETTKSIEANTKAVQQVTTDQETDRRKQQADVERLEKAIIESQILQVKATEQIQKEIRAVHPRGQYPEDAPELKAAKKKVDRMEAREKLFEGDPGQR